jgi:hypothetical protein
MLRLTIGDQQTSLRDETEQQEQKKHSGDDL